MNINKLRIICLSFLIACNVLANSQEHEMEQEVRLNDTNRILLLNQQAYGSYMQSMDDSCLALASQALHLSDKLIDFIEKSKDRQYLNRCKILKAISLKNIARSIRHADIRRALDTLETALFLVTEAGDKNEEASVYSLIGLINDEAYQPAAALDSYRKSLELYLESDNKEGQADQLLNIGISLRYKGNFGDAMENTMESLKISRQINDTATVIEALLAMGFIYLFVEKYDDAIKVQQEALQIYDQMNDSAGIARIYNDMGVTNMHAGKLDLALEQHQAALKIRIKSTEYYYTSSSYSYIASIYMDLELFSEAIANYKAALRYNVLDGSPIGIIHTHIDLGSAYMNNSEPDSAMVHFLTALQMSQAENYPTTEVQASMNIAKIYLRKNQPGDALDWLKKAEKKAPRPLPVFLKDLYLNIANTYSKLGDHKNAFLSLQKHILVKDSVFAAENLEKITTLSNRLEFENKLALQNENHEKMLALNQAQIKRQKITRNFSLFGMLVAFVLVGIVFIRFIEKKKLSNRLNNTLADLKSTQSQLIHAEKMASLGELTAGVAHEIQNPLNFVNNFSEVNIELVDEIKKELDNVKTQYIVSQLISTTKLNEIQDMLTDLVTNQQKINHHGKRADAIVKGMLQHSRTSSGVKEPTDINALADEYLRLAYHGLRAKDRTFNATMKTDYDEAIGHVNVVPQDLGRVILNLITNAFYAVNEKNAQMKSIPGEHKFEPIVVLKTRLNNGIIEISVKDNGNGIPQRVQDKIFQPFFTTKPTGQGTGLGLSLSYDIIKAHGGELRVDTKEGAGTEFLIVLPVS